MASSIVATLNTGVSFVSKTQNACTVFLSRLIAYALRPIVRGILSPKAQMDKPLNVVFRKTDGLFINFLDERHVLKSMDYSAQQILIRAKKAAQGNIWQ
jgi:hypothetical protein